MNPEHHREVEASLRSLGAAQSTAAQLAHAYASLTLTQGKAATKWLERIYCLAGRLHLHREGYGLGAARMLVAEFNPDAYTRYFDPETGTGAQRLARTLAQDDDTRQELIDQGLGYFLTPSGVEREQAALDEGDRQLQRAIDRRLDQRLEATFNALEGLAGPQVQNLLDDLLREPGDDA